MCHCALFQFITQDEQLILIKENGKNIVDLKTNGGYNVKRTDKENDFNQINAIEMPVEILDEGSNVFGHDLQEDVENEALIVLDASFVFDDDEDSGDGDEDEDSEILQL